MKFYNIKNLEEFFKAIDRCEGKVELITGNGDRLNLKSNLCKYVAFSSLINSADVPEVEIVVEKSEDTALLMEYMMNGEA